MIKIKIIVYVHIHVRARASYELRKKNIHETKPKMGEQKTRASPE